MLKPHPTISESLEELKEFFDSYKNKPNPFSDQSKFIQYFSSIVDLISCGVLIVSLQGEVLYINEEMMLMWDIDREGGYSLNILPQAAHKMPSPESFLSRIVEIYKNVNAPSCDQIARIDKQLFVRISKPFIFENEVLGRIWIYRNVTEKTEVFQVLEESKQRYETIERRFQRIFDLAPIGMSLNGLDGKFIKINRSFERLMGYSENELLSKHYIEITHPDDVDTSLSWVTRILKGEISNFQIEKRYIRKNGSIANVFLSVTLVFDEKNQPLYLIGQFVDLTNLQPASPT